VSNEEAVLSRKQIIPEEIYRGMQLHREKVTRTFFEVCY
jgi:hypothetical protein